MLVFYFNTENRYISPIKALSTTVLAILLVCISHKNSEAVDLEPLDKYLTTHSINDPAVSGYLALRCASLYHYVGSLISQTRNDGQELSDQYLQNSMLFLLFSAEAMSITGGKSAEDQFNINYDLVNKIGDIYAEESNDNYLSSGSYITDLIQADLTECQNNAPLLLNGLYE